MAFTDNRLSIVLAGTAFTDELHADCGSAAFSLNHSVFFDDDDSSENIVIRTAASGGGTLLVRGTDYNVGSISSYLTEKTGKNSYTTITITNVTYQTGNLYFSGKYVGDYVKPTDFTRFVFLPDASRSTSWDVDVVPTTAWGSVNLSSKCSTDTVAVYGMAYVKSEGGWNSQLQVRSASGSVTDLEATTLFWIFAPGNAGAGKAGAGFPVIIPAVDGKFEYYDAGATTAGISVFKFQLWGYLVGGG